MTALEAARALAYDRRLRQYLEQEIVDFLNRSTRYPPRDVPQASMVWRNATPDEQDAAAEELLREVIP